MKLFNAITQQPGASTENNGLLKQVNADSDIPGSEGLAQNPPSMWDLLRGKPVPTDSSNSTQPDMGK